MQNILITSFLSQLIIGYDEMSKPLIAFFPILQNILQNIFV